MYRVSKIVCGDNLHIQMDRDEKKTIELMEGTNQYIKIPIAGKLPPVKFIFEFLNKGIKDLKVYFSRKSKEPCEGNCEK